MKHLQLKGGAVVYIDWANVYGWTKSLKREVDPVKLLVYLKTYEQIKETRLYFGEDTHPKSKAFLQEVKKIGYTVVSKPVKYILVGEFEDQKIYRRKCDFDMEMCIDVHYALKENVESFIFFTGDGDFDPLYRMLIEQQKQVIVIYAHGHLGREIYQINKGIYKRAVDSIEELWA